MIIARSGEAVAAAMDQRLARARADAVARINLTVGEVRLRYITDVPGQDTLYTRKLAEAEAILAAVAAEQPLPTSPLLAVEVAVGNVPDLPTAALVVAYLSDMWTNIAAALEAMRFQAGNAINAAALGDLPEITDGWVAAILGFSPT